MFGHGSSSIFCNMLCFVVVSICSVLELLHRLTSEVKGGAIGILLPTYDITKQAHRAQGVPSFDTSVPFQNYMVQGEMVLANGTCCPSL